VAEQLYTWHIRPGRNKCSCSLLRITCSIC